MNPYSTRQKNIFEPGSKKTFDLSRSKIDAYIKCPRCFYLDRRLGVNQPASFNLNINNTIDLLFKKEFDIYRKKKEPHPIMIENDIDAIPFAHKDLEIWRDPFKGIRYHHELSNFTVFGGVDDIWINSEAELIIVDYKSTSIDGKVSLDKEWHDSYKKQIEIYQWLFLNNGFNVSDIGYFIYANAKKDKEVFEGVLDFDITLIPHEGDLSWIDPILIEIKEKLDSDEIPSSNLKCEFCKYREAAGKSFRHHLEQ